MDRRLRGVVTALVAVATLAASAGACDRSEADGDSTTTTALTPGPATVPPPTISEEGRLLLERPELVLSPGDRTLIPPDKLEPTLAYIRARQAWIRAGMVPVDPDHPDLAATTGGVILENVRRVLRESQARGLANQAPKVLQMVPKRFQVNPDSAWLIYCFAEQVPIYEIATGKITDDRLLSYDDFAELKPVDGRWIVTALEQQGPDRYDEACW